MTAAEKVGGKVDLAAHGYNPSIMQKDLTRCYICGRNVEKLDRHEIFHADYKGVQREKCKRMGLWVTLCHWSCHLNGVHHRKAYSDRLKVEGQSRAMDYYNLTTDEFIELFGKNYL